MAVAPEDPTSSGSSGPAKQNIDRRDEWSTVRVSNVPKGTQRVEFEKVFEDFGPVKKSWILEGKEEEDFTLGFVTFRAPQTAKEVSQLTDIKFEENVFRMELVPNRKLTREEYLEVQRAKRKEEARLNRKKEEKREIQKARLIIRNLPYKTTDDEFRAHFEQFGELTQSIILRKNGKMVGCGFVQYKETKRAIQAVAKANGKEFLGRIIAVDFAVPQYLYKKTLNAQEESAEVKDEIKEEEGSDAEMEVDNSDGEGEEESEGDEDEESEGDEEMEGDEESEGEESQRGDDTEKDFEGEKPRPETGHDVDEQKTVFIKNLSFNSEEEDLGEMMEQNFGPIHFAKIVWNKEMNVSKGTAFVKFKDAKDAAKCIKISKGSDGIWLDDRQLDIVLAIKPDEVKANIEKRKKKEAKDVRNLYLAREGLIREGSKAAEGVSKEDMAKRRFLMNQKKTLLANLHNFVSTTRLIVRNFPSHLSDGTLRRIILKWSPPKCRLKECRIMKFVDKATGNVTNSKGYAFVDYDKHEDALFALRNINNNPEVFTPHRRPIVDFSIEDRKALILKEKRAERSKLMNPTYQAKLKEDQEKVMQKMFKQIVKKRVDAKQTMQPLPHNNKAPDFSGATADPKMKALPKHLGEKLKKQRLSRKDLKTPVTTKDKKKIKAEKRKRLMETPLRDTAQSKLETPINEKKQKKRENKKQKKIQENNKFDNLVNKYKNNIATNQTVIKKWFD